MNGLKIKDFLNYKFLSDVQFSPNGLHLCFLVHSPRIEKNDYESNLWIYDLKQEEFYRLTNSGKDKEFLWLNEKELLFISDRESGIEGETEVEEERNGETALFKINIAGGEAQHVDTLKKEVVNMQLSDSKIIMTVRENLGKENAKPRPTRKYSCIEEGKEYHEIDEIPFWTNSEGFTYLERNHLYSYSLKERDLKKLVGSAKNIASYDVKGNEICLSMNEYTDKMEVVNYLCLYSMENDKLEKLTDGELLLGFENTETGIGRTRFFGDDILLEATDKNARGLYSNREIYIYDRKTKEPKRITKIGKKIGNAILTDIGGGFGTGKGKTSKVEEQKYYFLTTEGHNVHLNRLSVKSGTETVIGKEGSIDFFDVKNGKIAFIGLRNNHPQELYLYEGAGKRISSFNRFKKEFSTPEHFLVESNGREIDSWIMKPVEYEQGKIYPTLLEVHGGPYCAYGTIHFHEFQVLANNGYAIVFCNPFGSVGKGDGFADLRGKYGKQDYQDLMKVMDVALQKFDFIDGDRLGVTGGSYGGYMTNWIIGQTDRFDAAVSHRSISNLISMFGISDIGYFWVEDQFKASPWTDVLELWDRSPLKYADKVTTPTLFIHAREDYRCWEGEAIQMFTSLKYHGVDSKLILFERENHHLSRTGHPQQRMKRLEEMVDWFDKYLK